MYRRSADVIYMPFSIRAYRWVYGIALSSVAFMALTTWSLMNLSIEAQRDHGALINQAGKQRMLTQRVALSALSAEVLKRPSQALLMAQLTTELEQANQNLIGAHAHPALSHLLRADEQAASLELGRKITGFAQQARSVLEGYQDNSLDPSRVLSLFEQSQTLLPEVDQFVQQLEMGTRRYADRLMEVQTTLVVMTLILLLAEACFLFGPTARRIRESFAATEKAKMEEKAQKSLFASMLDNISDAIALTDLQGNLAGPTSKRFDDWFGVIPMGTSVTARLGLKIPASSDPLLANRWTQDVTLHHHPYRVELVRFTDSNQIHRNLIILRDLKAETEHEQLTSSEAARAAHLMELDPNLWGVVKEEIQTFIDELKVSSETTAQDIIQRSLHEAFDSIGLWNLNRHLDRLTHELQEHRALSEVVTELCEVVDEQLKAVEKLMDCRTERVSPHPASRPHSEPATASMVQ